MEEKKQTSITLGSSLCGTALTGAIIAIRAFQPGAEPMSSWSVTSWLWMTLPLTWPFLAFLAWGTLWLLATVFSSFFSKRT
jgi:hypothetical protein